MNAPVFRPLIRAELDLALSWATLEGWNPGRHDADAFWAADPGGFFGMSVDGQIIGSASIVSYDARLGFVGLFIVRPEWRGQGYGTAFWNFFIDRLAARLHPEAPMALDGVFTMQDYYAQSGFVFSHRNLRMGGIGEPGSRDPRLEELAAVPFEQIVAYDARHFGVDRPDFLRSWITPEGGLGLALRIDHEIVGCGVIRPCARGYKIGPLFAENLDVAESLYAALSAHAAGQPLFLDVPEINAPACALARRHGLREVFGCARMVRGPQMKLPWSAIYGVTTFELG